MLDAIFSKSKTSKQLTVIAGPCSAESQNQIISTAIELNKNPRVTIFRAGLWKPRTRPGSFAGVGSKGLPWLKQVKEQTRLLVCTEVASPFHVQECLEAGIDLLWIGARTTTNPFAIQSIADALKNTNASILIKNPVNPEFSLWQGAVERIINAGIKNIGIIHRGFSVLNSKGFRNKPVWQIVDQMEEYFPDIPIFCDPSHIAGNQNLILKTMYQALNHNVSGLMVESHINPQIALTDQQQQVTPEYLEGLLDKLESNKSVLDNDKDAIIVDLRESIDDVDRSIINIFKTRFDIVNKIIDYKIRHNMPILQPERWKSLMKHRLELAKELNVNEDFIDKIFQIIHEESLNIQRQIRSNETKSIS
ncbi:MAG: chorismate mutase [Solitalea-like symbiont of Tyrophagus putrescentiae]